jgi:hypothetical protein
MRVFRRTNTPKELSDFFLRSFPLSLQARFKEESIDAHAVLDLHQGQHVKFD